MKEDVKLKLQAYLDGELSGAERAEVETLLARNGEASDLATELRHTAAALIDYEAGIRLAESREFYWSKIQREISREFLTAARPRISVGYWLRRILVPAGAVAAIAVAVLLALPQADASAAAITKTTDAVAFTYNNYDTGATLVWLDYSSENNFSEPANENTIGL